MNLDKERDLEREFETALTYAEAKEVVAVHGYTAGKIRGAITRYCKSPNIDRPATFIEMKQFTPDFVDWWLYENPEAHDGLSESKTVQAVEGYLAFTTVWKSKFKNHEIVSSESRIKASMNILTKNALATAVKAALSYNKRVPKTSQLEIIEAFPKAFLSVLNITSKMYEIGFDPIPDKQVDEIGSLIGAYFAKDKAVLSAVHTIKQLESPTPGIR